MGEGYNRVQLIGNLGADGELRITQGGQAVLNLRLACSESYLDKDKVRKERTEWISCVLWGKRAEALSKILHKGSRIFVEGSIHTSSYDDREGNKRYKTEVNVRDLRLLGGRDGDAAGGGDPQGGQGGGQRGAPRQGGPPQGQRAQGAPAAARAPASDTGGGGDFDEGGGGYGGSDDEIPFASSSVRHDLKRTGMI